MLSLWEDLHNSSNDTHRHEYFRVIADLFEDKTLLMSNLQKVSLRAINELKSQFQLDF